MSIRKKIGMGSHQSAAAITTTWITLPHIGPALCISIFSLTVLPFSGLMGVFGSMMKTGKLVARTPGSHQC